jgi:hypothetical protein
MNRSSFFLIIAVGLVLLAGPTLAHSPVSSAKGLDKGSGEKAAAAAEANRLRRERQSEARLLLISLASERAAFVINHCAPSAWRELPTPCGMWMLNRGVPSYGIPSGRIGDQRESGIIVRNADWCGTGVRIDVHHRVIVS